MIRLRRSVGRGRRLFAARHAACFSAAAADGPLAVYQRKVAAGELHEDPSQLVALSHLGKLHAQLQRYAPKALPPLAIRTQRASLASATSRFSKEVGSDKTGFDGDKATLFGFELPSFFGGGAEKQRQAQVAAARQAAAASGSSGSAATPPQGVYMHGGVGCGKTFIMDMFYDCVPEDGVRKRRVHFHEFMLDVHSRMHKLRESGVEEDPVPFVARQLVDETGHLLCFDEMQVTDIADALVIRRLFDEMFQAGVVMVATSNRPPEDLYYNGIQRHLFVPFIAEINERCVVHDYASPTDYRLLKTASDDGADGAASSTFVHPLGEETDRRLESLWVELTKGGDAKPMKVSVMMGRHVDVPRAATQTDAAQFSFDDLCRRPLGAADYIAIARAFHTVFITDVPVLTLLDINEVRRMITCIDSLYEHNVKVIVGADAPITDVFQPDGVPASAVADKHGDLLGTADYVPVAKDEVFAFDRTVSRLIEMQSVEYKTRAQANVDADDVETIKQFVEGPVDDDSIEKLWMRYDADANGVLDDDELMSLLQDLSQVRRGHRNVEAVQAAEARRMMGAVAQDVTFDAFKQFVRESSIVRIVTRSESKRDWGDAPSP